MCRCLRVRLPGSPTGSARPKPRRSCAPVSRLSTPCVTGGLGTDGKLLVVGAPPDPLQVPAGLLIGGRHSIAGWPSGRSIDSEDTMAFAARTGVRSMNEIFQRDEAAQAYDRMMSGKA